MMSSCAALTHCAVLHYAPGMELGKGTLWIGDEKQDVERLSIKPLGRVENVVLTPISVECLMKFEPGAWERLRKVCAQVVTLEVDQPIPHFKKGNTITMPSGETGDIYHIRKPLRNSEARVYYIRVYPPNLR